MLRRALSFMVAILAVLTMDTAMAHSSSRWRWWQNPDIIAQLKLSQDEIKQLDDAYIASRSRMLESKGRVEAEQFELEELLGRPEFDEAAIKVVHRKMEAARSELAAEQFDFLLTSRRILGHERFQKLTEIQRQWREERRKKREEKSKENDQQNQQNQQGQQK